MPLHAASARADTVTQRLARARRPTRLDAMALLRNASGRVCHEREVARALAVDGGEFVDEGALPDRLQVAGELQLVNVALVEGPHLARDDRLHLVLDRRARLLGLVVGDEDRLLVHRTADHHVTCLLYTSP